METLRDDVSLEHPLLDDLATELGREYLKMQERLNRSLAAVLKRARGLTKSGGLYLIHGGLEAPDLFKAGKPAAKPAKKPADGKPKGDIKQPGKRGGKWWRDQHGHVRYGQKPEEGNEPRGWKPLDEDEVKKLHENLEAVYGYHHSIRDYLNTKLRTHAGLNGDLLLQVFRDANTFGKDIGDYWTELAQDAGVGEKDARDSLAQVFEAYHTAMGSEDFRRKARQAIQRRQLEEQHAGEQAKRSSKYSDGKMDSLLTGNVKDEAVRLLGLMSDMELLHIPHTVREASENFVSKNDAQKNVGNIVPNRNRLQALYPRLNDLNGTQTLAMYVAQMFRDMYEGKLAFHPDSKGEHAEGYFKDDKGNYETEWMAEGQVGGKGPASDVERANYLINSGLRGAVGLELDDADSPESKKLQARMREMAHEVFKHVEAFNSDQGGQELGLIFTNQIPPESLFKDEDALKELSKKVEEQKKLVADSFEAQSNDKFETPKTMVGRFGKNKDGSEQDLLPYQRQALNWMNTIKRGILAYDTGMGKTPMSIAMVAHMHELVKQGKMAKEDARGIMVMPLGLTKQWPNEIKKFFPDAKVVTIGEDIDGVDDRIKVLEAVQNGDLDADFVILSSSVVNFHNDTREAFKSSELFEEDEKTGEMKKKKGTSDDEVIAAMRDAAAGDKLCTALRGLKGCVFFDEAHHEQQGLKSPLNVRNAAAREFLKDRERSFLLTATPMPNGKPNELFELMDLVHPGCAGPDVKKFENKMSTWQTDPETGTRKIVGREDWGKMARDIAPYVFRKSKLDKDVLEANKAAGMELPPLVGDEGEEGGATHGIVMPKNFEPLWEEAGNYEPYDFEERQKKLPKEEQEPFKKLDELSQFGKQLRIMHQQQMMSVTPRLLFGPDPSKWPAGYKGEQPKLEHMAGLVKKHFQEPDNHDKPIVIFSQWPGSFEFAKEELKKQGIDESLIGEIHGGVSADDRNAVQEAANAGKLKVVFVGTQAGGAGLNLQKKSNKMIFLDQPWMIAHKQQALGRVWRTGQKAKQVEVINLYMKGTFDAKKLSGLETKSATDVAASSAHLDEETMAGRAQNMFLQVLGGKDATKIEETPDSELQARIDAKGLSNLITPKDLKQKFDIKPFKDTVLYKQHLDFGQQAIQTKRTVVNLKHKLGDLTPDEHKAKLKKLARDEEQWVQQNKLMGNSKVAMSKDTEPIAPEQTFVVSPDAGKAKLSGISDTAKAILQMAKKNGGSMTVSDFIDQHLKEHVEKEVKRDPKTGQPLDPMEHISTVRKWHDQRDEIEKEVKSGFQELEKLGVFAGKSDKTPKASETPLPQTKPPKTDKEGKPKHEPKPEPTTEAENNPKVGVNYSGGWGWNFEGEHTKTKEFKNEQVALGNNEFIALKNLVPVIRKERKKPKDFAALKEWLGLTDAATKKLIKQLHEHGVMT